MLLFQITFGYAMLFCVESRHLSVNENANAAPADKPKTNGQTQESSFKLYALVLIIVGIAIYLLFRYLRRKQCTFEGLIRKLSQIYSKARANRVGKSLAQEQATEQLKVSKENKYKGYADFEQHSEFISDKDIADNQNTGSKSRDQLERTQDIELDIFQGNGGIKKDLSSVFQKRTEFPSLNNEGNSPTAINQNEGQSFDSYQQGSNNVKSKLRSRIAGRAKVVDQQEFRQEMF